ncbi:MAG: copper amine oxidase N-terminal domain-containing protein [Monoglobales bacterium]
MIGPSLPVSSIAADVILDALGYSSETSYSDADDQSLFSTLLALESIPLPVSNSSSFEQHNETPSYNESPGGLLEPPVDFSNNSPASPSVGTPSPAAGAIKVFVYDSSSDITKRITFPDQQPVIVNDRTLIPVRGLFEDMGYVVSWDDATQTATLASPGITIRVPVGQNFIYRGDRAIPVDVPAQLINSRTMIPLRAISEAMGFDVGWDEDTKTVTITISQF